MSDTVLAPRRRHRSRHSDEGNRRCEPRTTPDAPALPLDRAERMATAHVSHRDTAACGSVGRHGPAADDLVVPDVGTRPDNLVFELSGIRSTQMPGGPVLAADAAQRYAECGI